MPLYLTYLNVGLANMATPSVASEDPILAAPLALDRLRAAFHVIDDLLWSVVNRLSGEIRDAHTTLVPTSLELYPYPLARSYGCVRPFYNVPRKKRCLFIYI